MNILRNFSAVSIANRFARCRVFQAPGFNTRIVANNSFLKSVRYNFATSVLSSREERLVPQNDSNVALTLVQAAEKNRASILSMTAEDQKEYFDNLWKKMADDKNIKMHSVVRFLQLKYEFGLDFSYEGMLADINQLGLRPDALFYSVFIRRSCEKGDMEETSFYLKAMHQNGAVPNDYIFSKILHGYVKCGLPDEVAVTQDVMSKLNYWPSSMATEDLLRAYADLGDGNAVSEILQDSLTKTQSLLTRPVFSPRFLSDLYVRLVMAPHFESNGAVVSKILGLIKKRPQYFDDFRIGSALMRLFRAGHSEAAIEMLRRTRPHTFSNYFLSKMPALFGDRDLKTLNDFWSASGTMGKLPEIVRFMTEENALRTIKACPPLRTDLYNSVTNSIVLKAVRNNDVDAIVEIGKILGTQRFHLLYLSVVPRLVTLGLKPEEILSKFEDTTLKSAASVGIVLNELCAFPAFFNPPQPGSSIETAENLVADFQARKLLPFTEFLSVNSSLLFLLLRGLNHFVVKRDECAAEATAEVDQDKFAAWTSTLFSCFTPDRQPLLASALLRACVPSSHDSTDSPTSISTNTRRAAFDDAAGRALANALVTYFVQKKVPISHLDLTKKSLSNLGIPEKSIALLVPSGSMSKYSMLASKLKDGEIEEVVLELRSMQKSISQETSPLGMSFQHRQDLLSEAFSISTPVAPSSEVTPATPRFSPTQLSDLYFALVDVAGLRSPSFSAAKVGEQFLNASDVDGLIDFLNKLSTRCPQHLSIVLSRWFITKFDQIDSDRARQAIEEILMKDNVPLPTLVLGAYNYELVQTTTEGKTQASYSLGPKLLSRRFETYNHLRKVRAVHTAIEELCQNHQVFAAYALRDWAYKSGMALLPQTTETLLASHVFVDAAPRVPSDLLEPDRMALRAGVSITPLISRLKDANGLATPTSSPTEVSAAVEAAFRALLEHPFVVDPSALEQNMRPIIFKKVQFAFWSAVSQVLDAPGSVIAADANLAELASKFAAEGHDAAVFAWASCLLRKDKIGALLCGGLRSPRSSSKFVEYIKSRPILQYAVVTSPALRAMKPEEKEAVIKGFSSFGRANVPKLSMALFEKQFDQALAIVNELGEDAAPVLAGFANARVSYLPLAIEVLKDKPLEEKVALVNNILDIAQTEKTPLRLVFSLLDIAARPNMLEEEKPDYSCLKSRLSISNQVFLRAFLKSRGTSRLLSSGFATGMEYFESIFPGPENAELRNTVIRATRSGKTQDLYDTLVSIQKSNPSVLHEAAKSMMLSQNLVSGHKNIIAILFTAAAQRNGELLDLCSTVAMPFLNNALAIAFKGLADIYRHKDIDPVIHEAIAFHRLGEFTYPVAQAQDVPKIESLSLKFEKPTSGDVSDPVRLAKESVNHLADILASNKLSAENAKVLVDVVRKLWGPGRIDLLLCHLVELNATEAVNQVIDSLPSELYERRQPFRALASLSRTITGECFSEEEFKCALDVLKTSPTASITLCLNGPHVSTLFSHWPEGHIDDALDIIENALDRSQPILKLQLAAALIHRGLVGKVAPIVETTGPLPYNYLVGSLHHPLNKESFRRSFCYLKETDPEHLPAFVDASLRNAAMSARSSTSKEAAVDLVKAALESAPSQVKDFCQDSTLRLLREATRGCDEISQDLFKKVATSES